MISTNLSELMASVPVCDLKMQPSSLSSGVKPFAREQCPLTPLSTLSWSPTTPQTSIKQDILMQLRENTQDTISIIFILVDHTKEDLLKWIIILPLASF